MALNPVKPLYSASATATNGSAIITVTGNVNCSFLASGAIVALGTRQLVDAVSGTAPDISGNSTITLRRPWSDPTTTGPLLVFMSYEGLADAVIRLRQIIDASEGSLEGSLSYLGAWDAGSNTLPTPPGEGLGTVIYDISVAGTVSGTDYKVGDFIIYDQFTTTWKRWNAGLGSAAYLNKGNGTNELPDNAQLNTRLGTTGNLGTAAQRPAMATLTDNSAPNALMPIGAFGLGSLLKAKALPASGDFQRIVIGLVDVTNDSSGAYAQFSGTVIIGRSNGVEPPLVLEATIQKKFDVALGAFNITFRDNLAGQDPSGIRAIHFTYNGRRYAGIDYYVSPVAKDVILVKGLFDGRVEPFMVPIYQEDTATILNTEIWNSRVLEDNRVGRSYNQWNAVGAVTYGFNRPTGAIIERGSNSNGHYTKFADGTLICAVTSGQLVATDGENRGSLYVSGSLTFNFPSVFSQVYAISAAPLTLAGPIFQNNFSISNTSFIAELWGSTQTRQGYMGYVAYGRWY